MAAIAALVRPECSSEEEAATLARRILDLERNESVQRGYLQEEAFGVLLEDPRVWSHERQVEATRQQFSEFDEVQELLDQFTATGEDHPLDRPRVAKFRRKMVQTVYVQSKGEYFKAQRLRAQSLRYLRRAGNQLVKGVRSLARTAAG